MGGFILGGTSAAVVIPMVKALKSSARTTTILMLESTITDVFCIIGAIGIATGLAAGTGVEASGLVTTAIFSLTMAVFFGVACGIGWSLLLAFAKRMSNAMFTNLAFAMVVYGLAEHMGVSGAIAVLCFGIVMGHMPDGMELKFTIRGKAEPVTITLREVSSTERKVYAETVFLLKAFFFFYLGLRVDLGGFMTGLGVLALFLAAIPFLPRFPMVQLFLDRKTTTRREAMLATVLVPRGLAAAVLAEVPRSLGLPGADDLASVVTMMVFLSILMVSILVILIERGVLDIFGKAAFFRFPLTVPDEDAFESDAEEIPNTPTLEQETPASQGATVPTPQVDDTADAPDDGESPLTLADLADDGELDDTSTTHMDPDQNEDESQ
jgi:NhaP-type Na+/H+ or K+/H+ antiporter